MVLPLSKEKHMMLTGQLSEFSLPEIFQLLEQGQKTGLLTIRSLAHTRSHSGGIHYIWLHQGRIVAAANRLDNKGLISMISQRGWLKKSVAVMIFKASPQKLPLGLCLKSRDLLQAEHLQILFRCQLVGQICALFEVAEGQFEFDTQAKLPLGEMTGLSLLATEATLMGLRSLQNWTALSKKLPDPGSALTGKIPGQPRLRLVPCEWQVWEYVNGNISLEAIASELRLPLMKVQQIAFRLIVTNLAQEVFLIPSQLTSANLEFCPFEDTVLEPIMLASARMQPADKNSAFNQNRSFSEQFIQNLMGFLQTKVL
jgi:Domain of unknown function (DUF4388)